MKPDGPPNTTHSRGFRLTDEIQLWVVASHLGEIMLAVQETLRLTWKMRARDAHCEPDCRFSLFPLWLLGIIFVWFHFPHSVSKFISGRNKNRMKDPYQISDSEHQFLLQKYILSLLSDPRTQVKFLVPQSDPPSCTKSFHYPDFCPKLLLSVFDLSIQVESIQDHSKTHPNCQNRLDAMNQLKT